MVLKQRQQEIKDKGFNLVGAGIRTASRELDLFDELDYAKLKVGVRQLDDAILNLGTYRKVNSQYGDKSFILRAIYKHDYDSLRSVSDYFYEASGIYYRLCRYLAFLYRYDWYITPYIIKKDDKDNNKTVLNDFAKALIYLDNSEVKRTCGDIALEVIKYGVYYGYIMDFNDRFSIQKLPASYCRSRYFSGTDPIVELNLQFFDAYFPNPQYRIQILKLFPKEVQKAYVAYKQGKLKGDYPGDKSCWFMLDPKFAVKISLNDSEFPPLVGVIPSIIDLDAAQDLDRKKTLQQLLKIVIQKLPLDKNGDLIFDVDEAKDIHNNAVAMLKRAVGVDVLTTFADIDVADMRDTNSVTKADDLQKVERTVFNNSGISQDLFNADTNIAVTNSILNDESSIRDLILRLNSLFNRIVGKFSKKNHVFKFALLETTQYNYKEMAKLYKEQAQMGYNKTLPQVALGQSQSSVLAIINFENDILHLAESMIPPMMSSTMNGNVLRGQQTGNGGSNSNSNSNSESGAGRPEKDDSQKSDKTIANREAAGK